APPLPVVLRATSKAALEDLGAIGGIPQPRTVECSAADVSGGLAVPTPAVVKPIRSEVQTGETMLHRTVVFADTVAEVATALRQLPDGRGLVQERVGGTVVTVDGLAWQGRVVCSLQKEALRLWPADGGAVPYVRTIASDSLSDAARVVLRELAWSGPFNLQVVRGPTGDRLIDLNPRAPDSLGLAQKAGMDLAVQWCDLLLGGTSRSATARIGVRWRSEEEEWWALVAAVRQHRWRDAVGIVRPHRRTAHAVWALSDPRPALLLRKRLLGRHRR
ncbi:MAG TPA: ATP-grasp domain-containing protein, partial [Mycobacteriales bacterium]|nr:ATP-grasp domain-containing protein [Mycobacteriales bacterium]